MHYFSLAPIEVSWRSQTRKNGRTGEGRSIFVPYVEVDEVRRVLREATIKGIIDDWSAEFQILEKNEGEEGEETYYVLCELRVFIGEKTLKRQDVGEGRDLKAAFSDALKRAALHYGIGAVLEGLRAVSVEVDAYGNPRPQEQQRLKHLVQEAKQKLYQPVPLQEATGETPAPPPARDSVDSLLEDMVIADRSIGELVDRSERKVETLKLLNRYAWKRGIFQEHKAGHISLEELKAYVYAFTGSDTSTPFQEALAKAKEKARELYRELLGSLKKAN